MDSRKTLALAEFPLKRTWLPIVALKARCHSKLLTASGGNELHPQKMVQLVGFRDPNARKHEGAASAAAVLASAA